MIYKFKSFENNSETSVNQAIEMIKDRGFWCSHVDNLNDPFEFRFKTIIKSSNAEIQNLYDLLTDPMTTFEQFSKVNKSILRELSKPIIEDLINKTRNEIGVCSFSKRYSNLLWKRYGGSGNGICFALKINNHKLTSFHSVRYYNSRKIQLLKILEGAKSNCPDLFRDFLASKTKEWKAEQEIRYLSKRNNVRVVFEESKFKRIFIGKNVSNENKEKLRIATKNLISIIKWL